MTTQTKVRSTEEALKMALEALELFCECGTMDRPIERREALRQAIEQAQKQEPVAWPIDGDVANRIADKLCVSYETVQLIARELTSPPQRQPLTDEQRIQMWHKAKPAHLSWASFDWYSQGIADAEAAHGITGEQK